MRKTDCVIVVPAYLEALPYDQLLSLEQLSLIILDAYDIVVACPEGLNTVQYENIFKKCVFSVERFHPAFFKSKVGYNKLCTTPEFYDRFIAYDYMLIYQTDAWIFRNEVQKFIDMGYDWYGAPWPMNGWIVGNGGFNLRRISKCREICAKWRLPDFLQEDVFFCCVRNDELNICPVEVALQFAWESMVTESYIMTGGKLPMGCHGWNVCPLGAMQWADHIESAKSVFNTWKIQQQRAELQKQKDSINEQLKSIGVI